MWVLIKAVRRDCERLFKDIQTWISPATQEQVQKQVQAQELLVHQEVKLAKA